MTENREPINELDALNQKYYSIFEELKEASPSLANCDAAFLSFVQNITEQYQSDSKRIKSTFLSKEGDTDKSLERVEKFNALNERFYFMGERLKANKEKIPEELMSLIKDAMQNEYQKLYELFSGEYDPEMDRKIEEQKALHERIVPKRDLWRRFLLVFKKPAQNHAADLVDIEANEKSAKVFAEQEAKIIELAAERACAEELAAEFKEKLAVYAEEQLAERAGNAKGGQKSEENAEEAEKHVESAADKAMKEFLNKKKKKDKQKDNQTKGVGHGRNRNDETN